MQKTLPEQLQHLVSWSVSLLGKAILDEYGKETFAKIEALRKEMKSMRRLSEQKAHVKLTEAQKKIKKLDDGQLYQIAHAYSLMLELINACETSYRTYRLHGRQKETFKKKPYAIIYVLTAHPTEARSPEILQVFRYIQEILLEVLHHGESSDHVLQMQHFLRMALKIPMARSDKPSVRDEADSIFSTVLRESILNEIVELKRQGITVHFRAWVGGDKDGHPGVNEKTMVESLQLSRKMILDIVTNRLSKVRDLVLLLGENRSETKQLIKSYDVLMTNVKHLQKLGAGDGRVAKGFYQKIDKFHKLYAHLVGAENPDLRFIVDLNWIFPALVLPLEIREDSEDVALALKDPKKPISKMLMTLREVAHGFESRWYVRGFVLSMVESSNDFRNGLKLARKHLGNMIIPVVPLFENEKALSNSIQILKETFEKEQTLKNCHKQLWSGRFEVMLGYSDSSKENGVFTSRYLISKSLFEMDKFLTKEGLTPVYFHGSGGSIERGGGSVREQTQWWPKNAVNTYKATIQGEMVSRTFAHEDILRRQVEIITDQLMRPRIRMSNATTNKVLKKFSDDIRAKYSEKIQSDEFFEVIAKATPYSFLRHLKIGSRPTKRTSGLEDRKLRAIPWILCWTQTRTLFPTWWGVGSSFNEMSSEAKWALKQAYDESSMLRSYVKVLGFTLSKVELPIWRIYLESSTLSAAQVKEVYTEFRKELSLTHDFVESLSGEKNRVWFRPWLGESILYRSSMIHPLNLIQLEALERENLSLLRETVTGISCGMMTTG
jgi:phosphoenolpyruvate carboxylase